MCGLSAGSFGGSPVGRGAGGGVFFFSLDMFQVVVSLPVFQLSRPEGGLAALPGTRRCRGGGVDVGTGGEGGCREEGPSLVLERRLQMSLQAFRCNKSLSNSAGPLKMFCLSPLALPQKV